MEEDFRIKSSVYADLGPLPEVVESDSETTWKMFVQLQEQQTASFSETAPGSLAVLNQSDVHTISADEVMAVARRLNRICPVELDWRRLDGLLLQSGTADPPSSITGAEFRGTPPLAKRIRVREQIEWAAQCGLLEKVHRFLTSLPEHQWVHFGD